MKTKWLKGIVDCNLHVQSTVDTIKHKYFGVYKYSLTFWIHAVAEKHKDTACITDYWRIIKIKHLSFLDCCLCLSLFPSLPLPCSHLLSFLPSSGTMNLGKLQAINQWYQQLAMATAARLSCNKLGQFNSFYCSAVVSEHSHSTLLGIQGPTRVAMREDLIYLKALINF